MTKPVTTVEAIATSCIAGRLRLLNRVVTNLYDDALRPFGVRLSQGNVLAVTAKLGVARPAPQARAAPIDGARLRRLALDCGADDAGLVEFGCPALDDQRADILRFY